MRKGGVLGSTPASGVPDRALAGWFHGAPLQKRAGYTERLKAVSEALTVAPEAGAIPYPKRSGYSFYENCSNRS